MLQKRLLHRLVVSAAISSSCVPAAAMAQEVPALTPIQVSGTDSSSALQPSAAKEKAKLSQVPGGTNLIEPQKQIRSVTLKDALDFQPGIVVQEFFGGIDQPRLNIRGSGIQSNPVNRGVLLMQDGLPLNEADGSFIIGFLEPRDSALISVRRGANATSPSATTLGGEMDLQSYTGTENDVLNVEGGSFGRLGLYAAKGFQGETLDGRVSVSHDKSDGYRHHSESERTALRANLGFKVDNFENRTYLSYTHLKFDIPNVVSEKQMYADPRAVMGDNGEATNIYLRDPKRDAEQLRIANRSYWGTEQLNQTFGVYWQTIKDTFTSPEASSPTDGNTWGAQWQLAGKWSTLDYRIALDWQRSDMDRDLYTINASGARATHPGDYSLQAENKSALLGLVWHVAPQWSVVGDLKYTRATRDASNRINNASLNQDWSYSSPKLGVIWQASNLTRLYANISRSNEAPTFWEIVPGASAQPQGLDLQRASTIEIGGDGRFGTGEYAPNWALSVFRSRVEDELMAVSNANGTLAGVYNYRGRTRHQGVEAGLNGSLPAPGAGAFDYRLAYTFSDFRFRGGEFDGNRIAGVPRHLLSAELMYRIRGLRFGPNVRWLASDTPTTHANNPDYYQKAYAIWGFKADYQHDKHWSAYVALDNIADKTYASSYVIRNDVAMANAPTYLPGNGRSVMAGFRYKF